MDAGTDDAPSRSFSNAIVAAQEQDSDTDSQQDSDSTANDEVGKQGAHTAKHTTQQKRSVCHTRWTHGRKWIWDTLSDPQNSQAARYFGMFMSVVIAVSTVAFVAETEKAVVAMVGPALDFIEVFSISVFTLDVAVRFLVCPSKRLFVKDMFNWVDLLAVLPYYINFLLPVGTGSFGVVRVIRLVRVFRVFKMSRYSATLRVFSRAMMLSALPLATMMFLVFIAMVLFSSAMYFAESTLDDCIGVWADVGAGRSGAECSAANGYLQLQYSSKFSYTPVSGATSAVTCTCSKPNPFVSIASAFWWCVVTMSSVGYGDVVPSHFSGKLVASLTMLAGIIILALPITVIGSKFSEVMASEERRMTLLTANTAKRGTFGKIAGPWGRLLDTTKIAAEVGLVPLDPAFVVGGTASGLPVGSAHAQANEQGDVTPHAASTTARTGLVPIGVTSDSMGRSEHSAPTQAPVAPPCGSTTRPVVVRPAPTSYTSDECTVTDVSECELLGRGDCSDTPETPDAEVIAVLQARVNRLEETMNRRFAEVVVLLEAAVREKESLMRTHSQAMA